MPKPRRRYGQHFLKDANVIQSIVKAINPRKVDHLVEIGPGKGALTKGLLQAGCKIDAIEIDRDLSAKLKIGLMDLDNFSLYEANALSFDYPSIVENKQKIRLVGNLPYNISTPLLFKLFEIIDHIEDMHFMFQFEVAQRLTSSPGQKPWGRLAILTQFHCKVTHLFNVPPDAFVPQPKVQSAVVRMKPIQQLDTAEQVDPIALSNATRLAFSQRRKTIGNNLKAIVDIGRLSEININVNSRAENLTLDEFIKLAKLIYD